MTKVTIRSTDRRGHITTTESDYPCPYFLERFIGIGRYNEKRAICEKTVESIECDYQYIRKDGTPICLRYWYGPKYEITDEIEPVYIQKRDVNGYLLYKMEDGTETTDVTNVRVMIPLTEQRPLPYIEATKIHKTDDAGQPLYWDTSVDPPVETISSIGVDGDGNIIDLKPVWLYPHPEFFSKHYEDTHEKVYDINGDIGWYKKV